MRTRRPSATAKQASAKSILVRAKSRAAITGVVEELKSQLGPGCSCDSAEQIANILSRQPGADSAEALKPLIESLPAYVAVRLPALLAAVGAPAKRSVLSHYSKDIVYRMDTAIFHGKAFLALTDLRCDPTRPSEWL